MGTRLKRRLGVVTGVIVIVIIVVIAIVAGSTSARKLTVAEAASGDYNGSKVQVTGLVVNNSYSFDDDVLTFSIYDEDAEGTARLRVVYDRGISATFGNEVKAICTGTLDTEGVLQASELVTQCPSKYENATDALGVEQLLTYKSDIIDKPLKITGSVKAGTLRPAGQGDRFVLVDASGAAEIPVEFSGALSDGVTDGSSVVITGSLSKDRRFEATQVALEG